MPFDEWDFRVLTPVVNEIKAPNRFLMDLLFKNREMKAVDAIEIGKLTAGRETAPFVRINGEAIPIGSYDEQTFTVKAPNIKIKHPFTPSDLMETREVGMSIFADGNGSGSVLTARQQKIARIEKILRDRIANTEEWLASKAIQGTISYSVSEEENFTITFPKSAGNTITLTTGWDDDDVQIVDLDATFHAAKQRMSDQVGLAPTHAIMGRRAAAAFRKVCKFQTQTLDKARFDDGSVSIQRQFEMSGAIFIGRYAGVDCWEYSRSVSVNGTSTDMIRTDYVEFVAAVPEAENVVYHGPILDEDLIDAGMSPAIQLFSKSWKTPDPSSRVILLQTRPLPCPRRPDSIVSIRVCLKP